MGRKTDFLLGRNLKTSKLKNVSKLAISRTTILKNQHRVRCSYARSDVAELLTLGNQESALLRVEHVIKEQNMLDVLDMVEDNCNVLVEKAVLFEKNKECPEELKEAVSSLIFASSRCGDFPELLHIREILTSRFGKEIVAEAVELRDNCEVNPKMIQKLSTRKASLESRLKVLKEIASENNITLKIHEDIPPAAKERRDRMQKQKQMDTDDMPEEFSIEKKPSELVEEKQFKDAADAAQEAFESAAYAAAAAKAAIELSRSESQLDDIEKKANPSDEEKI